MSGLPSSIQSVPTSYDGVRKYRLLYRPGYFGRRRDEKVAALNAEYGTGKWTLVWKPEGILLYPVEFRDACILYYEQSYNHWFEHNPQELDVICGYGECMDNAITNIQSGCDYTKQEAFSTHIQDIAIRNVLANFGLKFEGPKDKILVIRSADSTGYKYGPGNIPFYAPGQIAQPSKCPRWANPGSVEDFWQSNKYVALYE